MERIGIDESIVLQNGIHFETLEFEAYSDRVLDKCEEDGGKPFTGLAYERFKNGKISYYCYYADGFLEGDFVRFYEDGTICSISRMKRGQAVEKAEWHKNGKLKLEETCSYGIRISCKKWDEEGNIVYEKNGLTDSEKALVRKLSGVKYD